MTDPATHPTPLRVLHLKSIIIGAGCAIAAMIGATRNFEQFMNSYLFAYQFILGIALGSMALVMLHHMTGGDWGYCIRRVTEASAMTMPLLTLLFIPIALNTGHLYPWANPDIVHGDKSLEFQGRVWMNEKLWLIRACIYFGLWNLWAFVMWYGSGKHDRTGDPWLVVRMQRWSAMGLLMYVVTMTSASIDWIMAREAHWYSTILGLVICVSQALSGLVLAIAILRAKRRDEALGAYLTPPRLNDLGNLFLALTILWAYMSFAQLLIIWMGNITPDSPWYVRRGFGGDPNAPHAWKWIAAMLLLAHFFIPFFILLGRNNKRRLEPLSMLAILMLIMRCIDCFWWSGPTSLLDRGHGQLKFLVPRNVHWLDLVLPPALFGLWLAVMLVILRTRALLARVEHSPYEEGASHHAHAAA